MELSPQATSAPPIKAKAHHINSNVGFWRERIKTETSTTEEKLLVYFFDLNKKKASTRSFLRSNDRTLLEVPRTKCKTFDDRAFTFAGPSKRNKLPLTIRIAPNFDTFKKHFQTFLFKIEYDNWLHLVFVIYYNSSYTIWSIIYFSYYIACS